MVCFNDIATGVCKNYSCVNDSCATLSVVHCIVFKYEKIIMVLVMTNSKCFSVVYLCLCTAKQLL